MYNTRNKMNKKDAGLILGESTGRRGIDTEGVDLPVSICERLGVLIDD